MAQVGDVFRVTTAAQYLGENLLNVYYYRLLDVPAAGNPLEGLASVMDTEILPTVAVIQQQNHVVKLVRVENLNSTEIYERVVDIPGQVSANAGNPLPSFYAVTFQLVRTTRDTRHGSKRFGGIPDNLVYGNEWLGSVTPLNAIAAKLKTTWVAGLVDTFQPVIVRHPVPAPPINPVFNVVADCLYKGVRTQNTRKKGRGV